MLFSKLIASLFLAATVVFAAPVPTDQLSEQSVGLPQVNSVFKGSRPQENHHSLKLKHQLHQAHPHHEGQRKHVHSKVDPTEYLNQHEEEEEELQRRANAWERIKGAFGFGSSSKNRNPAVLTKPPPGVPRTNPLNPTAPRNWSNLFSSIRSSRNRPVSSTGAAVGTNCPTCNKPASRANSISSTQAVVGKSCATCGRGSS